MSTMKIVRRCYGCGAILQSKDPKKEGYIVDGALLNTSLDRVLFCDKCYHESSFNLAPHEPDINSDMLLMLEDAAASDALIVYVVDIFSFEASFSSKLTSIIKSNKILVIANKRDLLPSSVEDDKLVEYVAHRFRAASLPVTKEQVVLTSLTGGSDISKLTKRIDEERRRHDVYIIGAVGAGKSLFFSSFLRTFSNASGKDIVTEKYPGTSLRVMQIPLDGSSSLYDTPGTSVDNSVISKINMSSVSQLFNNEPVKANSFALEKGSAILIGGLAIIEQVDSPNKRENIKAYFGAGVSLKKVPGSHDCKEEFIKQIDKGSSHPIISSLKSIKDMDVFEISVEEKGSRDIGIEGLGWICFEGNNQTWRVYVPKGVSTYSSRSKIIYD
jgi:ribosome biogenesis GTPase A